MDLVETLQRLEPVFIQAGQLALDMQKGVFSYNKTNTGNFAGDIVTEADLAVQEFVLKEMVKTDLINCQLLAEEDTLIAKEFKGTNKYYLSIDPIDDTAIYARGGKHFSIIISLHDGQDILYMFVYFPAWGWVHKIKNNLYTVSGKTPEFLSTYEMKNTIIYWAGDPEKNIPKEIFDKLKNGGLLFKKVRDISTDVGSIAPFILGKVAGIYYENMNVYDGFVEYNIALAKGLKIYTEGKNGELNLLDIKKRETGLYYPGYYLALNN